jgi:hypothetical protein
MEEWFPFTAIAVTARIVCLFGLAYCGCLIFGRRHIDHNASWYLTGAVVSTVVGARLCHVWLGVNIHVHSEIAVCDHSSWYMSTAFFRILIWMIYLFGAMTAHFLIYFIGTQIRYVRRTRARIIPAIQTITGLGAIAGMIVLVFLFWCVCYSGASASGQDCCRRLSVIHVFAPVTPKSIVDKYGGPGRTRSPIIFEEGAFDEMFIVRVTDDGILIDDQVVSSAELRGHLQWVSNMDGIFIHCAEDSRHGLLLDVLLQCKDLGLKNISL